MKKLTINIIALSGLIITLIVSSCSVQHRQKQMRSYSSDRYHHDGHKDYDTGREHRYAPPRQY